MSPSLRKIIASAVIVAAGFGGMTATATAANAAPATVVASSVAQSSVAQSAVAQSAAAKSTAKKVLNHTVFKQNLPYNCGPSATLIVLST